MGFHHHIHICHYQNSPKHVFDDFEIPIYVFDIYETPIKKNRHTSPLNLSGWTWLSILNAVSISWYFYFLICESKGINLTCAWVISGLVLHFWYISIFCRSFWVENWLRYDIFCQTEFVYTTKMRRKFCPFLTKIGFFYQIWVRNTHFEKNPIFWRNVPNFSRIFPSIVPRELISVHC